MTEPTAVGPNLGEQAHLVTFWEAVATDAAKRAKAFRDGLTVRARTDLERDGVAPTWRIPGLGTVPLSLTSDAVVVTDPDAYLKWMEAFHPDEVETIKRVRVVYDEHLRKHLAARGTVVDGEGSVIPGLEFRPGGQPRGVSVRADESAKQEAADLARSFLDNIPVHGSPVRSAADVPAPATDDGGCE